MDFQESVNSSTEINGSGQLKQERSGLCDESSRPSKLHKPADDFSMFMRSGHSTMLSFSSPKSQEIPFLCTSTTANSNNISAQDSSRTLSFPLFDSGSLFTRASAYGSGGPNESPCGPFARFRGPFTPSQWMELEHQAMIYKHFVANVPVPHQLLIPLKRSLNPYAFSGLSPGPYTSNWGWGTFHLGFAGNTDPEPGRCRRTDGKKWRCSREAVPDQKYCERHINRGRHRSRKPVEGQIGHVVSGSTSSKVATVAPLQPTAANPSTHLLVNRMQDHKGVSSVIAPTIGLKPKDSAISVQKQHSGFEFSSQSDFGLVSTDSLLNPSQRNERHPVHHFIDGWKSDDLKSDWTQLSMSIPVGASDFSSSSNSPRQEKLALSPLRLSRDFDPIQMGLGVTNSHEEESMQKTGNWVPVSWGNSLGGPLGEVLNSTAGNAGWDDSHHFGSSPTGVLQKSTFVSLSNSSSGSSPRADSKKIHEGAGMCDEVIGSAVANSLCIPSM